MKKILKTAFGFFILIILFDPSDIFAQPFRVEGDFGAGWSNYALNDRGNVGAVKILASTTNATAQFLYNNSSGNYNPQWCGSNAPDVTRVLDSRLSGAAYYYTGGGWNQNLEFNMTDTRYYTFIVGKNTASNNDMSILETSYNPNTISSVSRNPNTPDNTQSPVVTATLGGVLNASEYAFIRYTVDNWSSSSLVSMSFVSGTDYSASIPIQSTGTTVRYYILTSNSNSFAAIDADYFSLEINDNAGAGYSYTVIDPPYTTAQDGDWNTTSTWTCNCIPPTDAATQINHDITLNGTATNNPGFVEITAGNSITFGASGDITVNSDLTNDGTIDMTSGGLLRVANGATFTNNSTFTGGTGEVFFPGTAVVSGAIIFNNVSIAGGVNFGASSAVSNILQIYAGGWLNTNSITYNSGSTLKYAGNYTINSGDKSWYSNVGSSGSAQEGIPWNVEIPAGVFLTLNDSYPFSINGNILIDGTFTLGTDGGTHWGNFLLRGNFTNNGTFTPNNREIVFDGTSPQTLTGATTFDYFQINGSGGLTLNNNIVVNQTLTFTNGKITLGANNITVDVVAGSISGGNPSSYAITDGTGYLIQDVGGSEKIFPIGTTTSYAPAYLTQAGTQENLYVRVKQGIDNPTNDDDFTVNLQWTIDEQTAGSNSITTKFQWNSTDKNVYFDVNGNVKIGRYISGSYSSTDVAVAGSDPYSASASAMIDDISAEIPFIVGNTMAFSANGYRTAQNGNWANGTTWVGGVVPPANAICAVLHHVTVNSTLNDADAVTIYANKSVTFLAAGSLTINGTFSNNGMLKTDDPTANVVVNGNLKNAVGASVNMVGGGTLSFTNNSSFINNGSFTAGTGTVYFLGAGTATGDLTFNNLNIAGNVDLGGAAKLNNILTLSATGDLINNSITYLEESLLKFDRNYSLADNIIWYRNVDANGFSQTGIPWNVQVVASRSVDISDNQFRSINGDLIIDGSFATSLLVGGDFRLKGDFINNGTYTPNSRQVEFYGNSNQKISGSVSTTFAYIKVNNNSNITLEKTCTVSNNLDFFAGHIILGNNDFSVFGSINSADLNKYIVTNGTGFLIKNVLSSSSAFYPIGTLSGYNPANLTQGVATGDNIGVRVQNSIDNVVDNPTLVVNVQWTINESVAGGNSLSTQFYWNATDEAGSFNRAGTVETRYYSGSYLPNPPSASTVAGGNPYNATSNAADIYSGNLSNLSFIVANSLAFSGGIYTINNGNWNLPATWNGGVIPGTGQCAVVLHNVTLDISPTVKAVSVASTGNLDCNGQTITLDNGGAISNSGIFNANGGKVVFSGAGSISTGSITFNDVDINGAVSFGGNSTIAGTLTINAGGSVNVNPPVYALGSTLKYFQGGNVARSYEWQYNIAEDDPGYPANVLIDNNTTFDVDADNNDDNFYQTRFLKGNLNIAFGSSINLNDMGGGVAESQICGVYAKGDINNAGTIILSSNFGGDMMLEGDIINSGTITWNNRAIFFTGDPGVNQNVNGVNQIPFVLITRGSTVVLQNNLEVNGGGTEFITFARPSSTNIGKVDVNGYTLSCTGAGNIELNDISGAEVIGTGRVEVSGGNATYSGIVSGTLGFGPNVTLAINGGTMTFPSSLGIVTVYGTLEVGDGATITNIPTYGNNSTLHYKKGGSFTMGVEWGEGSDIADNIPYNVTLSEGATPSIFNMNSNRYALGELLVEQNATFEVADSTGQLTVNNLTVDADGTILLKSPSDNGVAGSLITYGIVTNNGTMQAERYISGGKYTYVSPPNIETNSQLFTNNSNGYFNPNFYSYNQAFESPTDPPSATYSIWKDPSYQFSDAWVEAHDDEGGSGITLDVAGRGYAYFNDINKMFVFDGTFTSGDQTITVYYDDNDNDNALNGGYFDGWNLIANPYPSAMDWTDASWDKTYVDASVYYWDGTFENEGNYKYYVASLYDDGTNVVNGGSRFIPASQAVFVKAKVGAGTGGQTFTIPNDSRKHNTQDFWGKSYGTKNSKSSNGFIRLQATANNTTDELVVRYIPEGTVDYDGDFDAYKMYSYSENVPQIYSYNELNGAGYAINSLPVEEMNKIVPIGIEIGNQNQSDCAIELTDYNMNNNHIYIEDVQEVVTQNLIINPVYNFVINESSDIRERFFIHYEENLAPVLANVIPGYSVDFDEVIDYTIPQNTFFDENIGDVLTYTATHDGGEMLPDWLQFDKTSGRFYGVPYNAGSYVVEVTATDVFGEKVSCDFVMTINAILPEVQTDEIAQVSTDNATVYSTLLSNGGVGVSEVGICWSTDENPTLDNNYSISVLDNDIFIGFADNLEPNTNYFVRSYAVNQVGVNYGNQLLFTTNAVGIVDKKSSLNVFPNPTKDFIFISNENDEIISVKVFDVFGKNLILTDVSNKFITIDLSEYSQGVFFVEIKTTEDTVIEKIIKN